MNSAEWGYLSARTDAYRMTGIWTFAEVGQELIQQYANVSAWCKDDGAEIKLFVCNLGKCQLARDGLKPVTRSVFGRKRLQRVCKECTEAGTSLRIKTAWH